MSYTELGVNKVGSLLRASAGQVGDDRIRQAARILNKNYDSYYLNVYTQYTEALHN